MANIENSKLFGSPPQGTKIYIIGGSVGAGTVVQLGEHIQNILADKPDGDQLAKQFVELAERITQTPDLDDDTRSLTLQKTNAVAESLAQANVSPSGLRLALRDAKGFLGTSVGWAWEGLRAILNSEAAQKTIGTIADASTRAAISSLTGKT